ncbi:MAG: methyltransferase domain-containing protein [Anaerolineales bacterium]|nr:methyltransferase domain-containing protein [Anaerolineales bacterium]
MNFEHSSEISPIDYIGTSRPILVVPSNDTHVEWMLPLGEKLESVIFMILPERREGALEKLQQNGKFPISYREGILRAVSPSAVVLANDWGPEEYQIVQEARLLGIPSVGIQEGSVFFPKNTVKVLYNSDFVCVCGLKTSRFLERSNVLLTGSPKYDPLEPSSLPDKPVVIINCNFAYGIFEDIRMKWLESVISVCEKLGLDFFISQHPRDYSNLPSDLPVIKSAEVNYIDQLKKASVLVSRFSTMLYEAMLLGREAIYYDPHGENPDIFDDIEDGLYRAQNPSDLEVVLCQALQSVGMDRPSRQKFLEDYCGPLDHRATERCAQVIKEISEKIPYKQKKYFRLLSNAEQAFQNGDWEKAALSYSDALNITPAEPKLLVARGNLHLLQGKILPALRDFYYASHIHPEYPQARIYLAYVYILIGEANKAYSQLKHLEQFSPAPQELELLHHLYSHPPLPLEWAPVDIRELLSVKTVLKENPSFQDEIIFWWRELALIGEFGDEMLNRAIPERQHKVFPISLLSYLEMVYKNQKRKPRVLDVGSGPLSILGWGVKQDIMELVAVDPLAEVYHDFLRELAYPPLRYPLIKAYGESLGSIFGENSFDLIWMRNAIDHCKDPYEVMRQMSSLLLPGGFLFLSGFVREASFENGKGIHQFDFYINDDLQVICERLEDSKEKKGEKLILTDNLPLKMVECSRPSQQVRDWMYVIWQKA